MLTGQELNRKFPKNKDQESKNTKCPSINVLKELPKGPDAAADEGAEAAVAADKGAIQEKAPNNDRISFFDYFGATSIG